MDSDHFDTIRRVFGEQGVEITAEIDVSAQEAINATILSSLIKPLQSQARSEYTFS